MNCPACGMADTVTARMLFGAKVDRRARKCRPCGATWNTVERVEPGSLRAGEIHRKPHGENRGENGSSVRPGQPAELVRHVSSSGSSLSLPLADPDPPKTVSESTETTEKKRGRGRPSTGEYSPEFLEFWNGISRRSGDKLAAFREHVRISSRISPRELIQRWELWLTTDQWQRGYVPHVRKWLHNGGWEHDPDPAEFSGIVQPSRTSGNVSALQGWLDSRKEKIA